MRVFWTPDEELALATTFVDLRLAEPFEFVGVLLKRAMHKSIEQSRWRQITNLDQIPTVKALISRIWLDKVTAPVTTPTEPLIIQVEVEKPVDFKQLYESLDLPTIAAFAVGKWEKLMTQHRTPQAATSVPTTPAKPVLSIIEAATPKPRKTKVVVICMAKEFEHIRQGVNGLGEKLDINYVDHERAVGSRIVSDYVIIHLGSASHKQTDSLNAIPTSRVFRVNGVTAIKQKLYDIASMQK